MHRHKQYDLLLFLHSSITFFYVPIFCNFSWFPHTHIYIRTHAHIYVYKRTHARTYIYMCVCVRVHLIFLWISSAPVLLINRCTITSKMTTASFITSAPIGPPACAMGCVFLTARRRKTTAKISSSGSGKILRLARSMPLASTPFQINVWPTTVAMCRRLCGRILVPSSRCVFDYTYHTWRVWP